MDEQGPRNRSVGGISREGLIALILVLGALVFLVLSADTNPSVDPKEQEWEETRARIEARAAELQAEDDDALAAAPAEGDLKISWSVTITSTEWPESSRITLGLSNGKTFTYVNGEVIDAGDTGWSNGKPGPVGDYQSYSCDDLLLEFEMLTNDMYSMSEHLETDGLFYRYAAYAWEVTTLYDAKC